MKKNTNYIILAFTTLFISSTEPSVADEPVTAYGADYIQSVIPYEFDGDIRELPTLRRWQPGDAIKEIPKRRKIPKGPLLPETSTKKLDPLLAIQQNVSRKADRAFTTPALNFNGQGFSGVNPPDTTGDVGKDYYIQMINTGAGSGVVIYNKSNGTVAAGPITLDSLGSGNCAVGLGDPIVLYDQLVDRWMISEFSGFANALCVYISKTADPIAGGWYNYEFVTPDFPDYPKYSVWTDAYYVTTNEGGGSPIYALERSQMLAGSPATLQRMSAPDMAGFGFQALTPADIDGLTSPPNNSPAYFMRHRDDEIHNVGSNDATKDFLDIWEFDVDFTTPANTTLTGPTNIAIAEFDSTLCGQYSFNCFPQPGTGTTLDPLREVIMWRLQYRNSSSHETLVGNFVTDVNGSNLGGIRWFELRKSTGSWALYQQGTYSPDSVNRWMGAISMDGSGNIALGYNVSDSTTIYPGLRYTGRLPADTLGTMPQTESTLIAGAAANASNRYGDYSAMSIDPLDSCTFWLTGEYNFTTSWSTRIGAYKFDSCVLTEPSCSGVTVALQSRDFVVDTTCLGGTSINASSAVTVQSGATLDFVSPKIYLGPGFSVANGSAFRAGN